MIEWTAARTLLGKALPYLAIIGAAVGLLLYVNGLRSTVAKQASAIASLRTDLTNEQKARQRDVAGLTALSSGLAQAATDTANDRAILERTIDATHPAPASPGLVSLLDCLRANDAHRVCAPAASSTGR